MKHRLLCGVGIMILFSLGGCGSENRLNSMELENVLIIESSRKNEVAEEGGKSTAANGNSHNETMESVQEHKTDESVLQTNKKSEMPAESESSVAGIENSHSEAVETKSENASQILYLATIEGQMYLPEEENLSTNVLDAEGLYVFLNGLSYSNETCDGLPEYSIHFNDGSQYYVNITEGWIRRGNNKEAE